MLAGEFQRGAAQHLPQLPTEAAHPSFAGVPSYDRPQRFFVDDDFVFAQSALVEPSGSKCRRAM